ncbi:MAG: hypothetical protein ABR597_02195 [Bacteroidales bacterium]
MIQKLNITQAFKKKYQDWVNPDIISMKFCCDRKDCFLELVFLTDPHNVFIENLSFIEDDNECIDDDNNDFFCMFHPEKDFVDNATDFLNLDPYTIINCFSNLITKEAADLISEKHMNEVM